MLEDKYYIKKDERKRKYYVLICQLCLLEFYSEHKNQKFCSQKCNNNSRKSRIEYNCGYCNNLFERVSGKAKSKSGLYFCSRLCKDKAQSIDGLEEITPGHYGSGASTYRKRALRKYGSACAKCGYGDIIQMLDVHHKDGNRDNNNISNLEILCVWCHALITRKIAM